MWFVHLCNAVQETGLLIFSFMMFNRGRFQNRVGGKSVVLSEIMLALCCWVALFLSWTNWLVCFWVAGKLLFGISIFIHIKMNKVDYSTIQLPDNTVKSLETINKVRSVGILF